jgi:hypothetical protein
MGSRAACRPWTGVLAAGDTAPGGLGESRPCAGRRGRSGSGASWIRDATNPPRRRHRLRLPASAARVLGGGLRPVPGRASFPHSLCGCVRVVHNPGVRAAISRRVRLPRMRFGRPVTNRAGGALGRSGRPLEPNSQRVRLVSARGGSTHLALSRRELRRCPCVLVPRRRDNTRLVRVTVRIRLAHAGLARRISRCGGEPSPARSCAPSPCTW